MGARKLDPHKAAQLLVDADITTDAVAAKRHGVCQATIGRWRRRLDSDPVLYELYVQKKRWADRAWLAKAPPMIEDALEYMRRCTEAEPTPEMLRAIAGALKLVSEAIASREMIDARVRQTGPAVGQPRKRTGQVVPIERRTTDTG